MSDIAQSGANTEPRADSEKVAETKFFQDILKQPAQLAVSLSHMLGAGKLALNEAAAALRRAKFVLITGIGASWQAGMAMQAELLAAGFPAALVDASELLHFGEVPRGAAVVLLSRSGKSTEIVHLIQKCRAQSATIISITNQPDSQLAQGSDIVLNTSTDFDHAVSVSTYSAIALAGVLLALEATGGSAQQVQMELLQSLTDTAGSIPGWRKTIESSGWLGDGNDPTYFIARGRSLASCHEARLLWEEAAKKPATALTTGGFRHGPQEIVREGLRVGMWIDAQHMRTQDFDLARDLKRLGARVLLIGQHLEEGAGDCVLHLPAIPARWQFLVDVIPIQIAVDSLAAVRAVDTDSFRLCSYIVEDEGGLIARPNNSQANGALADENA